MSINKKEHAFVYVDVETTGAHSMRDRIIEIALIRVEHGVVTEKLNTVVDPETYLPETIGALTGITELEIKKAPTFNSIATHVHEMLKDAIFVAHNARFDYSFVKNELQRVGIAYQAKCLCTVKLSRALFSKYKKHDLSTLIDRFDFVCENRHRALSDACVLVDFIKLCEKKFGKEKCEETYKVIMKRNALPTGLTHAQIDALPESPGVYFFYGADNDLLYVGKSVNVRNRVLSHFSADHKSGKEMRMSQEVCDVEAVQTAGELSALLLESHLIKTKQPLYNRMSRHSKELVMLVETINNKGYSQLTLKRIKEFDSLPIENIFGIYRSMMQAKTTLNQIAKENNLCPVLLGIEKKSTTCFFSQLGICKGACSGKESPESYNMRVKIAFGKKRLRVWPYSGPVLVREEKNSNEGILFVIDHWKLIASFTYDEAGKQEFLPKNFAFDYDAYKILVRHMAVGKGVKAVTKAEVTRLIDEVAHG